VDTDIIHPDQWCRNDDFSVAQARRFYERQFKHAEVAVTALHADRTLEGQADALELLVDAQMGQAAVVWTVYENPVEDDSGLADLTPTERAETIDWHIGDVRVALRLAEAARAKATGTPRPRGAWPELENAAGHLLDRLADPGVTSAKVMAGLYGELIQPLLDLDAHTDPAEVLMRVWAQHAENELVFQGSSDGTVAMVPGQPGRADSSPTE
jgi:hypothetical protein